MFNVHLAQSYGLVIAIESRVYLSQWAILFLLSSTCYISMSVISKILVVVHCPLSLITFWICGNTNGLRVQLSRWANCFCFHLLSLNVSESIIGKILIIVHCPLSLVIPFDSLQSCLRVRLSQWANCFCFHFIHLLSISMFVISKILIIVHCPLSLITPFNSPQSCLRIRLSQWANCFVFISSTCHQCVRHKQNSNSCSLPT